MMASHHQPPAVALNELLAVVKAARALLERLDEIRLLDGAPVAMVTSEALRAALAELDRRN